MNPHTEWPLRRIVRREIQDGKLAVVLVCKHATLMRPLSRYSRFMPCRHCYQILEKHKSRTFPRTQDKTRRTKES